MSIILTTPSLQCTIFGCIIFRLKCCPIAYPSTQRNNLRERQLLMYPFCDHCFGIGRHWAYLLLGTSNLELVLRRWPFQCAATYSTCCVYCTLPRCPRRVSALRGLHPLGARSTRHSAAAKINFMPPWPPPLLAALLPRLDTHLLQPPRVWHHQTCSCIVPGYLFKCVYSWLFSKAFFYWWLSF